MNNRQWAELTVCCWSAACVCKRGYKAELLCTEQSAFDNVETSLELSIRLQHHSASQPIQHQRLMSLSQTQLPGQTGMLDSRPL